MTDLAEDLNGVLRIDIEEDDPSGRVLTCEMYTSKINYQHVHVLSTRRIRWYDPHLIILSTLPSTPSVEHSYTVDLKGSYMYIVVYQMDLSCY